MSGADPGRDVVEADVRREIAAHLELAAEAAIDEGLDPAGARARALARFGDVERVVRASNYVKRREHILMQRLNSAVMAILVVAVIALTAQTFALREESRQMARTMERYLAVAPPEADAPAGAGTLDGLVGRAAPPDPVAPEEILIQVGDRITVRYPTDGGRTATLTDEIDRAGMIRLPVVGRVRLAGLSRPGAESFLLARYSEFYQEPERVWIDVRSAYLD